MEGVMEEGNMAVVEDRGTLDWADTGVDGGGRTLVVAGGLQFIALPA